MERLNLSERPEFSSIEESIHLARYANILPFVKDKIVLDIACGEGYGSALMMRAGAKQVIGVDISEEAINKAKQNFYKSGVEYIQANAEEIIGIFKEKIFDVIVSIETIEHVEDDVKYLQILKKVAKDNAIFLITCPNDHWYFKEESQSNPFHLRKYKFDEFKKISVKVLGDNVKWSLGTPIFGFGSVPYNESEYEKLDNSWMEFIVSKENYSLINKNDINNKPYIQNCSYFVGIWNVSEISYGNCYFGVGMDAYEGITYAISHNINEVINSKDEYILELKNILCDRDQKIDKINLINKSLESEIFLMKENIYKLICSNEEMKIGYWRYRKITDNIPDFLKKMVKNIMKK